MTQIKTPIIEISGLKNYLGDQWVHTDVNLSVNQGEIFGIIGGSGSGKTTILRSILMLLKPTAGSIHVFGQALENIDQHDAEQLYKRWGVLYQHSALFSGMSVLENIMFPMQELANLPEKFIKQLALIKLVLVGLPTHAAYKLPSELSGGMQRRAAAARAILFLRRALNLTVVIVSHDIDSLSRTADRVAFVGEGEILAIDPIDKLMKNKHPLISKYFSKNIN